MARSKSRSRRIVLPNYVEIVRLLGGVQENLDRNPARYLGELQKCAALLKDKKQAASREADERYCFNRSLHVANTAALFGSSSRSLDFTVCYLERFFLWRSGERSGRDACTAISVSVLRYLLTDYMEGLVNGRLADHPDLLRMASARIEKDTKTLLANAHALGWMLSPKHVKALGL